jgi:hypothetical protein
MKQVLRRIEQALLNQQAATQAMDGLGDGKHAEVGERLDNDYEHIGRAERGDRSRILGGEALAVERPKGDPEDDSGLIGRRECERLTVFQPLEKRLSTASTQSGRGEQRAARVSAYQLLLLKPQPTGPGLGPRQRYRKSGRATWLTLFLH